MVLHPVHRTGWDGWERRTILLLRPPTSAQQTKKTCRQRSIMETLELSTTLPWLEISERPNTPSPPSDSRWRCTWRYGSRKHTEWGEWMALRDIRQHLFILARKEGSPAALSYRLLLLYCFGRFWSHLQWSHSTPFSADFPSASTQVRFSFRDDLAISFSWEQKSVSTLVEGKRTSWILRWSFPWTFLTI